MTSILGLNAYHGDSSACLVVDGRLIAAAEEERFRRVKHWAGLPAEAIAYCLKEGGLCLQDVQHIALNRRPRSNNFRRLFFLLRHRPDVKLVLKRLQNIRDAVSVEDRLAQEFNTGKLSAQFHYVEHHLCHVMSAFAVSPFEEAVCISIDGFGDFASAAWGKGSKRAVPIDGRIFFPHSLGIFYSAITQHLGFPHFGDEYKIMGLAPYGNPTRVDEMRQIVKVQPDGTYELNLRCFRHHTENVAYTWNNCAPEVGTLYTSALEEILGPSRKKDEPLEQKHKDLARSAQAMYEEAFFALLNALYAKYKCPHLALAGGCAMNSVANGKVYLNTPFRRMYLPAAAGDAGGAIGAAYETWFNTLGPNRTAPEAVSLRHAYTGPQFSSGEIKQTLYAAQLGEGDDSDRGLRITRMSFDRLCEVVANAIAVGKVVGWFQGRMEWGPRALGNRSILGDPRRGDMKDILNCKIKRRESFRPFAPSILRERTAEWFEQEDDVPFMMQVFQVREDKRSIVPATTHVDGSGRLHTVEQSANPLYHRLISEFFKLTGVPMVLNTSFNENEPVVCQPKEALDCFLRTQMDVLALGDFLLERVEIPQRDT